MTTTPPESEFGPALARLFRQAGKPTLRLAAQGMAALGRAEATQQRISDWRNGRHIPRDFEAVEPLIMWLNRRALDAGADDLLSLKQWRELWRHHHEPTPVQRLDAPFPGLASMSAADRDRYFGRDHTVAALTALLRSAHAADSGRLVVVTGVSGAGKSSLLGAGLARAEEPWNQAVRVAVSELTSLVTADAPLLVVDQFEEVFALDEADRRAVLTQIAVLADAGGVVVLGIRADFYRQCVEYPGLARAWQDRSMIVAEMSDEQLRSVITEPVALAGGKIDDGLADLMIEDLHQASPEGDRAGHLPLLAHALQVMWSARTGNRLTVAAYRESGGITSAVAETAEATWAALDPADREEARAVLLSLIDFGPRRTPMRHAVSPTELRERFSPSVMRVIDAFADSRLLTVGADAVTFIHDAVLSSWPRMAGWIAADADRLQWRQQLAEDAETWNRNDRRADYLYSGARLETALAHRTELGQHRQILMPAGSVDFLDAARHQQRRRGRLRMGAVGAVIVLGLAAVVTAVIALKQSADLERQRNGAEHTAVMASIDGLANADPSLAARILTIADRRYPDDRRVRSGLLAAYMSPLARSLDGHDGAVYDVVFSHDGRLLATAGNDRTVRIWERADGRSRPFTTIATLRGFGTFVTSVTFDESAQLVAAASGDGTVRVWSLSDRRSPTQIAVLRPGAGAAYLTRFSPSGRHLVTSSDDGTVTVYRINGTQPPVQTAVLRGHRGPVRTLAFNAAGTVLATGGEDQTVRLWTDADSDSPRPIGAPLTGFPSITHALAFLPGDRVLAVTGDSANVQLWNVADPAAPTPEDTAVPGVTAGSWSIAANPEQPMLARAGFDGVVHVWNTSTAAGSLPLWDLQRSPELGSARMMSTTFSPDGHELVVGRSDGSIDIWTIPSGLLPDRGALISSVDVDGTGTTLATVGSDARMNVWTDHDGAWRRRSSIGIERRANNRPRVAVTTDGSLAATVNNNGGLVELWDIADPDRPRRAGELRIDTRYAFPVAFAPGTRELAIGSTDMSIQRWDVGDPAAPTRIGAPLIGPSDLIRTVSYSADGNRLAVGSDDGNAYVYRLSDVAPRATVLPMGQQVAATVFTGDGNYLVTGGEDLVVWRLTDDAPEIASRIGGVYADTIGRSGTSVMVGRGTREITDFQIDDAGRLAEGSAVTPVLGRSHTVTRWVLPTELGDGDVYPVAGDGTGVVYLQGTDVDAARAWICRTTRPLTTAERVRYLGRLSADDGCPAG
ncbi:NACHT and WD repeat domain-containing protein [Gordonia hydrophobica]|uniref:AAA family ATPase n=1 Tax=Gordonia hydrophobica TaxID=40516 RepID=A0ABZ2U8K7_9ACTN|nr:AAA family ATPase [Gordonia hydrophobica]MBM7369498.1 WD40 repeat protein [Gordonia hydrophobica]